MSSHFLNVVGRGVQNQYQNMSKWKKKIVSPIWRTGKFCKYELTISIQHLLPSYCRHQFPKHGHKFRLPSVASGSSIPKTNSFLGRAITIDHAGHDSESAPAPTPVTVPATLNAGRGLAQFQTAAKSGWAFRGRAVN